jgi:hypothetical protein
VFNRDKKKMCPFMRKPCIESDCTLWILVRGKDPQSNKEIDDYGCAIAWMPVLQIENAQQTRQAGAAVESLRNVVDRGQLAAEQRGTTAAARNALLGARNGI